VGTPSLKKSRLAMDLKRQTIASSFIQAQYTERKAAIEPLPEAPQSEAIVMESLQPCIAPAVFDPEEHLVVVEETQSITVLEPTVLKDVVEAAPGKGKLVHNLLPILNEIEDLKTKLDEIRKQKALKSTKVAVDMEEVKEVSEGQTGSSGLHSDPSILVQIEASAYKEDTAVAAASGVSMSSPTSLDALGNALEDANLTIDILNRLSYCRIRKYKSNIIEVETALSGSYRIVIEFTLTFDDTSFVASTTRRVSSIAIEVEEKGSDRNELNLARLYFAKVLCSNELEGPLSGCVLDAVKDVKHLAPLFRKVIYLYYYH
jgi:hypothetical protein